MDKTLETKENRKRISKQSRNANTFGFKEESLFFFYQIKAASFKPLTNKAVRARAQNQQFYFIMKKNLKLSHICSCIVKCIIVEISAATAEFIY